MQRLALLIAVTLLLAPSLAAQSDDFGAWQELFNGKDLSGWTVAKPRDDNDHKWVVAEGTLHMPGGGGIDLSTEKEFTDYELSIEYKLKEGGNSGVYLRGTTEIQVHKDRRTEPERGGGSAGAIYSKHPPLAITSKPAGEWNTYRILHIGPRITVWHNGELIQDNVYFDGVTGGAMGSFPPTGRRLAGKKGPLMLQGDHGTVWYRNIRIRPLFTGDGWRPLVDGENLDNFTAMDDRRARDGLLWAVKDHAFGNTKHGGACHDLWTKESFGNFLVHYAYRSQPTPEGENSGFYLRDQWEIQILSRQSLTDKHSDGSLYSLKAPAVLARHGPERWNHMDIKVEGMKIWVWQNGKLIHDGVVLETRTDNHGVKTLEWSKKPFKLQGDHGLVQFTDLWIKPLPDAAGAD